MKLYPDAVVEWDVHNSELLLINIKNFDKIDDDNFNITILYKNKKTMFDLLTSDSDGNNIIESLSKESLNKLMQNEKFKRKFLERYKEVLSFLEREKIN